ncbi:hypothetical protein ACHAXA_000834 [Cyclostephanos tholiformis]|uniref:TLDc domain-containing protein n=1 Tax=Cyclostephanos tholiformis TaxID=382380 RepID=A0ABD3RWV4_9STRA
MPPEPRTLCIAVASLVAAAAMPYSDSFVLPSPCRALIGSKRSQQPDETIRGRGSASSSGGETSSSPTNVGYPEGRPATYELQGGRFGFGPEYLVRPLLKQTQLQDRKLVVAYDAERDGWDARTFHRMVDGRGASVVLAKVRGRWIGGYNPRGWASLGGSRPSVASFLFYQRTPSLPLGIIGGGWQKLRVSRTGGMACGKDEYDAGIYFGSDALVMPLNGARPRSVTSRLGYFFESGPEDKSTLLPVRGADAIMEELYVLSGIYEDGEDIPNSGGVTDLGLY